MKGRLEKISKETFGAWFRTHSLEKLVMIFPSFVRIPVPQYLTDSFRHDSCPRGTSILWIGLNEEDRMCGFIHFFKPAQLQSQDSRELIPRDLADLPADLFVVLTESDGSAGSVTITG
jgi:hypothetical protein